MTTGCIRLYHGTGGTLGTRMNKVDFSNLWGGDNKGLTILYASTVTVLCERKVQYHSQE